VRRVERLANRVAISILAAAAIDGLSELAAHNNPGRSWRRPVVAAGVGLLSSLTAYRTWKRYPLAAQFDRLRPSS
jgi:hypothetical protein